MEESTNELLSAMSSIICIVDLMKKGLMRASQ